MQSVLKLLSREANQRDVQGVCHTWESLLNVLKLLLKSPPPPKKKKKIPPLRIG